MLAEMAEAGPETGVAVVTKAFSLKAGRGPGPGASRASSVGAGSGLLILEWGCQNRGSV